MAFFFIFLIIRIVLDALDGHVARKYNKETDLGYYLDYSLDLVYFSALIFLMMYKGEASFLEIIINIAALFYLIVFKPEPFMSIIHDNTLVSIPAIVLSYMYMYPENKKLLLL